MEKLDNSIKAFNLVFTDTIDRLDLCQSDFEFNKVSINYDNCINLYDLVSKFNNLFAHFKKEYKDLNKIIVGENIEIDRFKSIPSTNHRFLSMHIYEPCITSHEDTYLYLVEDNGKMYSYVTNDINPCDKEYYYEKIDINPIQIKEYLDLFEKYNILIDLYKYFRDGFIYSDGTYILFSKIESIDDSIFDSVQKLTITLGSNFFKLPGDHIKICLNTIESSNIDISNSEIRLGNDFINANESDYLNILKNIYINGKYLETYYDRSINKSKDNMKRLLKVKE